MKSGPLGTRPLARLTVVALTVGALLLSIAGIAGAVGDVPVASFTVSKKVPDAGTAVTLDASGSTGVDDPATYDWDFDNDGTYDETGNTTPTTSHAFAAGDDQTVKLQVTDADGSDTEEVTFDVTDNSAPTAGFDYSPASPKTVEDITFTDTSTDPEDASLGAGDSTITSRTWDLDDDGVCDDASGESAGPIQFPDDGAYDVKLCVEDEHGETDTETKTLNVANRPPTGDFVWDPEPADKGQPVDFTATAADLDGTWTAEWEFDNDGLFDDATGTTATWTFAHSMNVRLRITDDDGEETIITKAVAVGDKPPTASFVFFPASPLAGDTVTFVSTSTDPDGPLDTQAWDLDGDGLFGEAGENGERVTRAFPSAGNYTVRLRVRDIVGPTAETFESVSVQPRPAAPPPAPAAPLPASGAPPVTAATQPAPTLSLLNPFPIVRMRGRLVRGGRTRITVLTIDMPRGASVVLRCRGRSCPFRTKRKRARGSSGVTFRRELRRNLRSGVVLRLYIEKKGTIGKYTRFKIRKGRAPLRKDACLLPGSTRPRKCPA